MQSASPYSRNCRFIIVPIKRKAVPMEKSLGGPRLSIFNTNRNSDYPIDSLLKLLWYHRNPLVSPSKTDFLPFLFFNYYFLFSIKYPFLFVHNMFDFHNISTFLKLLTKFVHDVSVRLFGTLFFKWENLDPLMHK